MASRNAHMGVKTIKKQRKVTAPKSGQLFLWEKGRGWGTQGFRGGWHGSSS